MSAPSSVSHVGNYGVTPDFFTTPSFAPPTGSSVENVASGINRLSIQAILNEQPSQIAPLVGIPSLGVPSSMEMSKPSSTISLTEAPKIQQRVMQLKDYLDGLPDFRYHMCSTNSAPRFFKHGFIVYSPGLPPSLFIKPCRQAGENPASELRYQLYAVGDNDSLLLLGTFVVELLTQDGQRIENGLKHHRMDEHACKLTPGSPDQIGIRFVHEILHKDQPCKIKISVEGLGEETSITGSSFIAGTASRPSKELLTQLSTPQTSQRGPMRPSHHKGFNQSGPYTRPMEPFLVSTPFIVDQSPESPVCALSGRPKTFTTRTVALVPCGHTFDSQALDEYAQRFYDSRLSPLSSCPMKNCGQLLSSVIPLQPNTN